MSKPSFVYVTYIATTPRKVWQALVDGKLTRQYWGGPRGGVELLSDWKQGSRWESRLEDGSLVIVGRVVESEPPRRLVMTWAKPQDADVSDRTSRVTFEIEDQGDKLVRLTVVHEDLDPETASDVSGGWPKVLSNLKTFLETGRVLTPSPWS
jgi:uncharacterized protein YndB with AHSA1/START domain